MNPYYMPRWWMKLLMTTSKSPIKPSLKRCSLSKKLVRNINYWYRSLENFGSEHYVINFEDDYEKLGGLPPRHQTKSYNTSRSSAANLKDLLTWSGYKKFIGLSYKCTFENLIENWFQVLKEMKIIWKQWNSNFIYKCQSGMPIGHKSGKRKSSNKLEEFSENSMIKFFLHFSSISGNKGDHEHEGSKQDSLYLVSFIWIKGNTLKFLDFVSIFKIKVDDKI